MVNAQDSNFCGTNWADASSNCANADHCPSASNDECTTPGHKCFADTSCSAIGGDGKPAKHAHLRDYLDVDYDDASNSQFCGSWWVDAEERCGLDTACSSDGDCDDEADEYCVPRVPNCNVLDLLEEEHGSNWKEKLQREIDVLSGKAIDVDDGERRPDSRPIVTRAPTESPVDYVSRSDIVRSLA